MHLPVAMLKLCFGESVFQDGSLSRDTMPYRSCILPVFRQEGHRLLLLSSRPECSAEEREREGGGQLLELRTEEDVIDRHQDAVRDKRCHHEGQQGPYSASHDTHIVLLDGTVETGIVKELGLMYKG